MVSEKQLEIAARLDKQVRKLEQTCSDSLEVFMEMGPFMSDFKALLDSSTQSEMDELTARFDGLYHYGKILESIAMGIASGDIQVPESE